ncbi:MAG: nucleotidyltransferase domain-containing protein [Dehalococcoidia bacterium]
MTSQDEAVALAARIAHRLIAIDGVAAVALGGSRARGTATPESDVDLGLYYHASHPPSIESLGALACQLDDGHREGLATNFGEWGAWVNGGAWLRVEGVAVDWLYRDMGRVTEVIQACRRGEVTCDYYLGHPHGFHNHIYLGEVHCALPLEDPGNGLNALKLLVAQYPPEMRARIVSRYRYDARFMLEAGRRSAARGDVMHAAGCLFRVVAALVQVVYALNERYFVSEKGSVAEIEGMPMRPARWSSTVSGLLGAPGTTPQRLLHSGERAERLVGAVEELCRRQGLPSG